MTNTVTLSTINASLKEDYEPIMQKHLFENSLLEKVVKKNVGVKSTKGNSKIIFHNYGRSAGTGSIAENGILPVAGNQAYSQSEVEMTYLYGSINLSDVAIEATKDSAVAIASLLESEMESNLSSMKRQVARQTYGNGSGVICLSNAVVNTTTVVLKSPVTGPYPTFYLEPGQYIYLDDGTTAAGSGNVRKIVSVDSETTITVDSNVTVANNDVVAFAQVNGSVYTTSHKLAGSNKELTGLQAIIDDGTNSAVLQGITRSTAPYWNSFVDENSGTPRAISTPLLNKAFRNAKRWGNPKLIITTPGILDAYGETLESNKRFVNELELKGGFTGVKFRDMIIYADDDAPLGTAFVIDVDSMSFEELAPMGWMDRDGSVLFRGDTGRANYMATSRCYMNIAGLNPRKNARLDDITDPDA